MRKKVLATYEPSTVKLLTSVISGISLLRSTSWFRFESNGTSASGAAAKTQNKLHIMRVASALRNISGCSVVSMPAIASLRLSNSSFKIVFLQPSQN